MSAPRHSVSVAGVVFDAAGRVLMIRRRDTGDWQPPGGVLELDEPIEAGLRREILEETGVTAEPEALTGVYKNMRLGVVALVFRCRFLSGEPGPTAESVEAAWLGVEEATAAMTPAFAIRVTDATREVTEGPALRHHDGVNLLT